MSNGTLFFDFAGGKAEQVYPCRCGETHRIEEGYLYRMLLWLAWPTMCPDCGKTFVVEGSQFDSSVDI